MSKDSERLDRHRDRLLLAIVLLAALDVLVALVEYAPPSDGPASLVEVSAYPA